MAKKNITVTINHPPFAGNFCEEGLRTVVGTHLSMEEQMVNTVFLGDGIYFGLKDMNQTGFLKYLKTMKSMNMDIFLEEEAITARKIDKEQIHEDFRIIARDEIAILLKESDHVLAF